MKRSKADDRRKDEDHIRDLQSEASRERTSTALSQDELPEPHTTREQVPEADRDRFHDGVYSGTGTGAGIGGSTDTGGADTSRMEAHPRMGTTDDSTTGRAVAGGSVERSSAMSDDDARLDRQRDRS
jgi:hypothetical protein